MFSNKVLHNQETRRLRIWGKETQVNIPDGMKPAHGVGLDGKSKVNSLLIGISSEPGKVIVEDIHGNCIITTAHELFVAAKDAAIVLGYTIIVAKMSIWRRSMRALKRAVSGG